MKYFVLAGEASGDLHGSNLIRELNLLDPSAQFVGWGGDLMMSQGVKIQKHYHDLAFMGFTEVLFNLKTIIRNFKIAKQQILNFKPDVLILIDYPGFNLRMAKWAKEKGIKVFYYISPTVWAWKESRVEIVRKYVDKMYVILPFEKPFYKKHQIEVVYEGHPLLDAISQQKEKMVSREEFIVKHGLSGKPIIAVLPGSRRQEIAGMLPLMSRVQREFTEYEFVVAGASSFTADFYSPFMANNPLKVIFDSTHELLNYSQAGIIKSGTSTLESALYNLPQVVCYKGGALSIWIAKKVAKVKYISLPNLILDEPVLTELIQQDFNEENLKKNIKLLVSETDFRARMLNDYQRLSTLLGGGGASGRLAKHMYNELVTEIE